jgi:N-acetylneuraminic acid mutarotase
VFTKTWTTIPPMHVKRYGHASVLVQNRYIFVFGGRDERDNTLDSVERYDFNVDRWVMMDPMPTKR